MDKDKSTDGLKLFEALIEHRITLAEFELGLVSRKRAERAVPLLLRFCVSRPVWLMYNARR